MSQAREGKQVAHERTETAVPTFSIGSKKEFVLNGQINEINVRILVDTGAAVTVLSQKVWDEIKMGGAQLEPVTAGTSLVGVQGSPLHLYGTTQQQLCFQGELFSVEMIVADSIMSDVILGRDFLKKYQCTIDLQKSRDVLHLAWSGTYAG